MVAGSAPRGRRVNRTSQTVSVVVPARDAADSLPALLDAIGRQERAPDEVIVADDASVDTTAALAEAHPVVTRVVHVDGRGPGTARNAAARVAVGDVLAFTDADCVPTPGWLAAALEAMATADVVQGAVHAHPCTAIGPFDRTIWVTHAHGLYETANLLMRRELFERLGGFEPWLSPRRGKELGEDVWLGYRAQRAGARIVFCGAALVHHAVEPRRPIAFVAERLRLRFFPVMARRIPELRDTMLYRRVFLSAHTARFDLALTGLAVTAATRRPLALAAAVPYVQARRRLGVRVALVDLTADAAGAAALVYGSIVSRSPVL